MSLIAELKRRNVLRVCAAYIVGAWAIAQVADLVFESFGAPEWAMRAVLVALLVGLPIAAIGSWALELGPDGLQRDEDSQPDPTYQARARRRLNRVIAGFFVVGAALLATTLLSNSKPGTDQPLADAAPTRVTTSTAIQPSIAVLPFIDTSPAQDQRHLADGVAIELMTALHRVEGLRVVSRTSAFAFRDTDQSIRDIAETLSVDHIVEGSVSRSGERVRIDAAVVDVRTDERLWSDSYTQDLGDAFALQAGITRKIATALRVVVGDETDALIDNVFEATANPEAYEEFLLGTTLWSRRGEDNIRSAIEHLKRALELEPNFARAEAALATAYITLPGYSKLDSEEQARELTLQVRRDATIHAQNAIALDPELVDAYVALADLARWDSRWSDADRLYKKGLSIDPSDATLNLWYSEHLQDTGKLKDAHERNLIALRSDPLSPGANANLAGSFMIAGDCEALAAPARKAVALGHEFGDIAPLVCEAQHQRWTDVLEAHRALSIKDPHPDDANFDALLVALIDAPDDAARVQAQDALAQSIGEWGDDPVSVLLINALDNTDMVMAQLLSGEKIWGGLTKSFWGPKMVALREHPRFLELLDKAGLLTYFRDSGELPDECVWVGEIIDCVNKTPEAGASLQGR